MSARDKLARMITLDHLQLLHDFDVDGDLYRKDPECADAAYATAAAILAALPDMVPDLVWPEGPHMVETILGTYRIGRIGGRWNVSLDDKRISGGKAATFDEAGIAAKAAANAHHRAQIMAALGVTAEPEGET